ncbi:hypothetical protein ES703_65990 [subsurface metagenome]
MHVKIKIRTEDSFTQIAVLLRLGERRAQALHGQRVLGADVEIAFAGTDSIGRNCQPFQDGMRVGF